MKTFPAVSLFLLAILSGPVPAETPVIAPLAVDCPLAGPLAQPTEVCAALRVAYRSEINDCMHRLRSEADARAGQKTAISSHTSRARFRICDAGAQQKMADLPD